MKKIKLIKNLGCSKVHRLKSCLGPGSQITVAMTEDVYRARYSGLSCSRANIQAHHRPPSKHERTTSQRNDAPACCICFPTTTPPPRHPRGDQPSRRPVVSVGVTRCALCFSFGRLGLRSHGAFARGARFSRRQPSGECLRRYCVKYWPVPSVRGVGEGGQDETRWRTLRRRGMGGFFTHSIELNTKAFIFVAHQHLGICFHDTAVFLSTALTIKLLNGTRHCVTSLESIYMHATLQDVHHILFLIRFGICRSGRCVLCVQGYLSARIPARFRLIEYRSNHICLWFL